MKLILPKHIAFLMISFIGISTLIFSCKKTNTPNSVQVGDMAPDFILSDPSGNPVSLSDLNGKTVLIDFWASWCSYCRAENPDLVEIYDKYKDEGFEILAVSLDKNKTPWLEAIQSDGLDFIHVSDLLGFDSPVVIEYGVSSIPRMYLVNPEGKVVLITTSAHEVEEYLQLQ